MNYVYKSQHLTETEINSMCTSVRPCRGEAGEEAGTQDCKTERKQTGQGDAMYLEQKDSKAKTLLSFHKMSFSEQEL